MVWLRWKSSQQNSAQQHAISLFLWYKELETKLLLGVKRWKHSFISSFPHPPWLFRVTVYPNEGDDRRGRAEKTAGRQQRRALGSIAFLSCQHWPATIMHTLHLYSPDLFQHRNKTQRVYCSGGNIDFFDIILLPTLMSFLCCTSGTMTHMNVLITNFKKKWVVYLCVRACIGFHRGFLLSHLYYCDIYQYILR